MVLPAGWKRIAINDHLETGKHELVLWICDLSLLVKLISIILAPHESQNGSTALYVITSTPILLQTTKAVIYKPGLPSEKFLARLILDSGSQRSNVTTKVLRRWESIAG